MAQGSAVGGRLPGWAVLVAVTALATGMLSGSALMWRATHAAFNGAAGNPASAWSAGRVSLTDDDGGSALFTATGLKPGSTGQKCINVTYGGTVAAGDVRIYGATPTGTLGAYLAITVELGTTGAFANCGAFSASSTPINDVALSTVGTKANYSTGYSTGWSPAVGESRVFRFTYTMSSSIPDSQESATASMPFTWEAQAA